MRILTLNCRSYFIQFQLCDWARRAVLARGTVERIELGDSYLTLDRPGRESRRIEADCPDHRAAVALILQALTDHYLDLLENAGGIDAVGHRVVHGGETFTGSTVIDRPAVAAIRAAADLAPLHNPANAAGIEAAMALLPGVPHVAVFDTAFHQTMPPHAYLYPLPYEWYERHGVRRYGFHGASHCHAARRGAALLGRDPAHCNLVTVHIGNGTSLCAVQGRRSIDTSMGLTPLEGVMMGARCGDIDPGILSFIMQRALLSPHDVDMILNQKSGVAGITGVRLERHDYLARAAEGDPRCRLALEMEAYRIRKYLGAYAVAVGRLDAVVFGGGAGYLEWLVRERVLDGMESFGITLDRERNRAALVDHREETVSAAGSRVPVFVILAEEEMILAEEVAALLNGDGS
ncbi:MAG: acetate kinase [Desulfuromonadales bacterium]|nr:MAG: acetate kinase [Desulfuromonadales bacterium]